MAVEAQQQGIVLTELEQRIFDRLLGAVDRYCPGTQLRVAGGWVRDKLLGEESDDIDIALDNNMTGQDFCRQVNKYLEWIGEEQKTVCVSQRNPDKSKHLETAKMKICEVSIDFVNLRSETYAENSRIPIVENCEAKVDALRRDLTINSLFYNITTKSLEDLTGRGHQDLKNGLIATPSPAKATFLDDPLRVLRAIRFAARFSFTLAEDLRKAASDEEVKSGLRTKISRERIGIEVDHMMSGKDPVNAMCYIRDLGLFYVVFEFPEKPDPLVLDKNDWLCVSHIEEAWNLVQLIGCSVFRGGSGSKSQAEQRRLCLYSALFYPVRNMVYMVKKSKKVSIVSYIIGNSLKFEADAKTILNVHTASEKFSELILVLESNGNVETFREKLNDEYLEIPTDMVNRVLAGLVLYEIKELWRVALLISTLSYLQVGSFSQAELQRRKEKYVRVERWITDLGLEGIWYKLKNPLLDGHDIQRVLQIPKGRLVGNWLHRELKWQLAHPRGTKEECEQWMKQSLLPKRQKVEK
ncbi:CCA tRNA nucleotidyltransferase, mitochondrial-like [Lolium rigidum]|uniref:CCA tRNA nucleotidyltransferase, mitochondrial-like n=1 Tax=Lolium rigidum TaxID=89674 RepID=UPI001F5C9C4E|nr:CCA tRNA nucleotidyltransferase, mitochondrial-like [Lolium rigidum]